MEGLSEIGVRTKLPLKITISLYLLDHHLRGRVVLPAVEAMVLLAATTKGRFEEADVHTISDARFHKFLYLEKGVKEIDVFVDMERVGDGNIKSRLLTKTRSKKAKITRTMEHAVLHFRHGLKAPEPSDFNMLRSFDYTVSAETVYEHLVPFGSAYRNLKGALCLSEKGARGEIRASHHMGRTETLGSPFVLDAAFHAACVWGQRYGGVVGFPVGFGLRRIFHKTQKGNTYAAVVLPRGVLPNGFSADIWILDKDGRPAEVVQDAVMKDVSGGTIKPPSWLAAQTGLK